MQESNCRECQMGYCRPANVPFVQLVGKQVLTLPNAPAFRCDMCGSISFDAEFLITIRRVLAQLVVDDSHPAPRRTPTGDALQQWSPARRSG